ncbi:hypothetical protein TWF481_009981 [Arthrobotrys musiformis]|uniref:Metallo-beta-lactamase domain-containing protein n=1 Tax=Arthrobotrys musiformis TaxID=47236 RepID=A0AAV9VZI0_9PEZI
MLRMANLVPLLEIERLSSRVIRILGGNPGKFTLQGTNTYLVGTGPKRLLIDAGEGKPAWKSSLSSVLASERATVSTAIITHWHGDHIEGVPDLRSICPDVKVLKFKLDPKDPGATKWGFPEVNEDGSLSDEEIVAVEGATVKSLWTPGHAGDHVCLWLEEEQALFTGDNVLGQGTTVFEDLSEYMSSLAKMLALNPNRAYPAHGPLIPDAKAKIQEYITHRQEREIQVVNVLKEHRGTTMEVLDIVKVIYKDYPENLWEAAGRGVLLILEKLEKDGRAVRGEGGWRILEGAGGSGGVKGRASVL